VNQRIKTLVSGGFLALALFGAEPSLDAVILQRSSLMQLDLNLKVSLREKP
jgi:hypothetical protein